MRVVDYVDEPSTLTEWAACGCAQTNSGGNDRAGNPRYPANGGWRGSREFCHLHAFQISLLNAFKPLCPIPMELKNFTGTPDKARRVGYQADVRMANIASLTPGQVVNIAGDNWYFFPWVRKQFLQSNTEESWNGGVAYKRIDA